MTPFDGKCQNLQMSPTQFCASFYRFSDIKIANFYLQKAGQDHRVPFSQLHHSTANDNIYRCIPQIFALALTSSKI